MILADTSIWIDHLRSNDDQMAALLRSASICTHPFVIGELALGNLQSASTFLSNLQRLPSATIAKDDEVLSLIHMQKLAGLGIGYVDTHLLAATRLTKSCKLWTRDRKLRTVAHRLSIAASFA